MLLEMSLAVRLVILVVVVGVTIWATIRGFQYGVLLILPTGMTTAWFIRSEGSLPHISLDRLVWPTVFLIFLWAWRQGKTERCWPDLTEWLMLILLGVILLSMALSGSAVSDQYGDDKLRMGSLITGFLVPFGAYFVARRARITNAQTESFLIGIAVITIYLGITGVGEAFHQDWLVYPKYILDPNEGIHFGKVRGPFVSASKNGLAMAMALPIFIWLLARRRDLSRWLWILGIVLVTVSMPYVLQRGPWLGTVVALGVMTISWPKYRAMLTAALVLAIPAAIIFMLSSNTLYSALEDKLNKSSTIDYRLNMIDLSLEQIRQHPWTGVGFNRLIELLVEDEEFDAAASHNSFLTLFAELGLLGFLPYILIFALLFLESAKVYWQEPWARGGISLLWSITAPFLILMNTTDLRSAMYHNVLFFFLWGIALEAIRKRLLPVKAPARHDHVRTLLMTPLSPKLGETVRRQAWNQLR